MAVTHTTAGIALLQGLITPGTAFNVDSVQIGTLAPAQRYDAAETQTALVDTTPLVVAQTGLTVAGRNSWVQHRIRIPEQTSALAMSEIGLFVGATLYMVWADADGDLGAVAAGHEGLATVQYRLINGVLTGAITISVDQYPIASPAQKRAGTADNVLQTPGGVRVQMAGSPIYPREIPDGANLDTLDAVSDLGHWYKGDITGLSGKPDGITGGRAHLEVLQIGDHTSTQTLTMQRLSVFDTDTAQVFARQSETALDTWDDWVEVGADQVPTEPDVQTFTSNGNWNKPAPHAAIARVVVELIHGGDGGQAGTGSGTRTQHCVGHGGDGGLIGSYATWELTQMAAPNSAAIIVGQGGAGGIGQRNAGGSPCFGRRGGTGGSSSFGGASSGAGGTSYTVQRGGGGEGAEGGMGPRISTPTGPNVQGLAGSTRGRVGTVLYGSGAGGNSWSTGQSIAGALGSPAIALPQQAYAGAPPALSIGRSGNGAQNVGIASGGRGGNGAAYGGGGAGGGGARGNLNGANGGDGGDGVVRVTTYFTR